MLEYPALRRLARDGDPVIAQEARLALDLIDLARATGWPVERSEDHLITRELHLIGTP